MSKTYTRGFTITSLNIIKKSDFYDLCKNEYFGIPIEKIITYLGVANRRNFIERLRSNYVLEKDFQTRRLVRKSSKGIKDVIYMISYDCFLQICMMSNTDRGNEFRNNFKLIKLIK